MTSGSEKPDKWPRRRTVAVLLVLGLFAIYLANDTVLDEGDAVPSVNLPVALLSTGRLSFDPEHFPELFKWSSHPPFVEKDDFFFTNWKDRFGDYSAREWKEGGQLEFNGPRYYIVPAPRRDTYVSTFGPIPGLLLLPVVAPFYAVDHDFAGKLALRCSVAKLGSSMMVALTAMLILLIAEELVSRRLALLVALTYGLATCAWAVSSQNIWQQTVNQLLLALGAYFVVAGKDRRRAVIFAGFALGAAAACRPTSLVALLAVLAHLWFYQRKNIVPFLLGAAPVPIAIFAYNQYYFGNPFTFAQALIGHDIAREKTGSSDVWQTPFFQGLIGLLASPSRGLLIFSPILGASFWGIVRSFRSPSWTSLRPFLVTAIVMMAIQCKWFDWWGGHAYGYRPWLDAVPYLVLGLLPVAEPFTRTTFQRVVAGLLLAWSVFVQAVGAMSYDRYWNLRRVFVIRVPTSLEAMDFTTEAEARSAAIRLNGSYVGPSFCDIDYTFCRHRLWSVKDNLILYQLTYFALSRSGRLPFGFQDLGR
jgi:hypothetical protein